MTLKMIAVMLGLIAMVSAQANQYCANPNDYDGSAVASTTCQTTNVSGCTSYGQQMNDINTECHSLPPALCTRIGGTVQTQSCDDYANFFAHVTSGSTQQQICSSGQMRLGVALIEAQCCSGQPSSGYCGVPDVCLVGPHFNASADVGGDCYTTQQECTAAFGRYDNDGKCRELSKQECIAANGAWSASSCGFMHALLSSYGLNFSACNLHDGSAHWNTLLESSCCNGNPGRGQCTPAPPEGICSETQYWEGSATFSQDCDRLSSQDCTNAGGNPDNSNNEGKCNDLSPEACVSAGGRLKNYTCDTVSAYAAMGYINFTSCSNLEYTSRAEAQCCGGNPGSSCSAALPQICPDSTFEDNVVGRSCMVRSAVQQNACINAGYSVGGDDNEECNDVDESTCVTIGGTWSTYTCRQTQFYLAGVLSHLNLTLDQACQHSHSISQTIQHMGQLCCETPQFTCGAPPRICRGRDNGLPNYEMDTVWRQSCRVCRNSGPCNITAVNAACQVRGGSMDWNDMACRGISENECQEMNGSTETITCGDVLSYVSSLGSNASELCTAQQSATNIVSMGDVCCSEGQNAHVCGEPLEICRNPDSFLEEQTLFEECVLCEERDENGPTPPNCANNSAMAQSCSAVGGTFNEIGHVCENISIAQCASMEGARWSSANCKEAQYYVTGVQSNITNQCGDSTIRPKFDLAGVCCASGGTNRICPVSPALRRARRLILRFRCLLRRLSFFQRQLFIRRILARLIDRGLLTQSQVENVQLIAQQISDRRRSIVDYVDVEIALNEDVSESEENAIIASVEQNPIDVEIDGDTFSSESAEVTDPPTTTAPVTTTTPTSGTSSGSTVATTSGTSNDPNAIQDGNSGDSDTAIIAGAVAAVVALIIIVAVVLIVRKRQKDERSEAKRTGFTANPTYESQEGF